MVKLSSDPNIRCPSTIGLTSPVVKTTSNAAAPRHNAIGAPITSKTKNGEGKITYGSNVKEVTTQVSEAAADAGIIYATDAFSEGLTVVDQAEGDLCKQVIYPAAVLNISKNPEAAKEFLAYLQTDTCMQVFEAVGFTAAE